MYLYPFCFSRCIRATFSGYLSPMRALRNSAPYANRRSNTENLYVGYHADICIIISVIRIYRKFQLKKQKSLVSKLPRFRKHIIAVWHLSIGTK